MEQMVAGPKASLGLDRKHPSNTFPTEYTPIPYFRPLLSNVDSQLKAANSKTDGTTFLDNVSLFGSMIFTRDS